MYILPDARGEPTDAIGMIVIAADKIQTRQPWTGIRVPVAANRSACAVGLYHGSQLIFWVAVLVVSNSLRASSLCEGHLVGLWLSNAGVSVASVYCLVGHLASCRSAPSKSICKYLAGSLRWRVHLSTATTLSTPLVDAPDLC